MTKEQVVLKSVQQLKDSEFGVTAFKFEFEAQLNRSRATRTETCEHMDPEACEDCNGSGSRECEDCEGRGITVDWDDDEEDCDECSGRGSYECPCDSVACTQCVLSHNWGNTTYCHDWILERLVPLGLAEAHPEGYVGRNRYGESNAMAQYHRPTGALKYSKFYNDGSVDSEWTLTLSVSETEAVLLAPKLAQIFKDMAELIKQCGGQFDIRGAGMHMALINDPDCVYPSETRTSWEQFRNFRRSMQLLLPALYFLGATCEESRGLGYRQPEVSQEEKYSAIHYNGGALEFRLFDTCYDNVDQILDNIVVISNCMKYWREEYLNPKVSDKSIRFGNDNDRTLERFYTTTDHIDILNAGLQKLKPSYYTIKEIKQQRKFGKTKRTISSYVNRLKKQVTNEYGEYEERFKWRMRVMEHQAMANIFDQYTHKVVKGEVPQEEAIKQVTETVKQRMEDRRKELQTLDQYINNRISEIQQSERGSYTLAA